MLSSVKRVRANLVVCVFVLKGEEFGGLGLLFFEEEFTVLLEVFCFFLFDDDLGVSFSDHVFKSQFCAF